MVKVKEINVTANYAWSPAEQYPITIACGTAAQQLDATFSTNSSLSLYEINVAEQSLDAKKIGEVETTNRFHKVIWGHHTAGDCEKGLIVCGSDNGQIKIFDPVKILNNETAIVHETSNHSGPVKALDFNPFQKNLFASGASESEIYIWDLKNPTSPMTPGTKTTPLSAISAVAWNRQVQHILGSCSTLNTGPACVVWDLRKNEPVIKVQDSSGRMQCSDISWHPDVATQLVLASEDDHLPVVQLWDLRFATSPLRTMESHTRGVLSAAWCQYDADLLLTCGKDSRVLCWNPNSAPPEVLYELPTQAQWCFDVKWCPRNPNMVSTGSFDGHISVHSLLATSSENNQQQVQNDKILDSFGGDFTSQQTIAPQKPAGKRPPPLKKPPKWIRRPCGATFVFGGKMVSFKNTPESGKKTVDISQVVTETEFVKRSSNLQTSLDSGDLTTFCSEKVESSNTEFDIDIWNFLKVRFTADVRKQYLNLLGYNSEEITQKLNDYLKTEGYEEISAKTSDLNLSEKSSASESSMDPSDAFEIIAANQSTTAVNETPPTLVIPTNGDMDSKISQSLLIGDYETAVKLCIHDGRMADAIILSIAGGPELLSRTQDVYFKKSSSKIPMLLSAVVTRKWSTIVDNCDLDNWKEALAAVLTYSSDEEMPGLCDALGTRLETSSKLQMHACLCYICSGNVGKLVECWDAVCPNTDGNSTNGPQALQDLIEKVMVLRHAVRGQGADLGGAAAAKLAEYASLLASQGKLETALAYLPTASNDNEVTLLRNRLTTALSQSGVQNAQPQQTYQQNQNYRTNQVAQQQLGNYQQNDRSADVNNPYKQKRLQKNMYQAPTNMYSPSNNTSNVQQPSYMTPTPNAPMNPMTPSQMVPNAMTPSQMARSAMVPNSMAPTPMVPTPMVPSSSAPSAVPNMMNPVAPNPMAPAPQYNSPSFQPNNTSVAPPNAAPVAPARDTNVTTSGWNDPPAFNPNRVPKKKKATPQPIVPQDYNIMTPATVAAATSLPPSVMSPMSMPHMMPQPNVPQPMQMQQQQPQQPQQPITASVPTAAPSVQKAALPPQHVPLQNTFDGLIEKCKPKATNPQMRKKLEDCTRRMEFLYDKLRGNSLSPTVVAGLNQITKCIEMRDYAGGLRQHAQIVSTSNFSEISSFMPGVKIILQIASQLRI